MVKIAVAGGSGAVAREVIDALLAAEKHEITILSRSPAPENSAPGLTWSVVDYDNKLGLSEALSGIHTLLSFVQPLVDLEGRVQKTLVDAAVLAGVKRFAPSEYGSAKTDDLPIWAGKQKVREYLLEVNKDSKAIEYTLFQPGLFLDYLAFPHKTSKHIAPLQTVFDFQNARALVVEGHEDAAITFTSAKDLAGVIARAIEHDGEWPSVGGIQGNRVTFSQLLDIGARVRGRPFAVEKVKLEDLEAGKLQTSWLLGEKHKAVVEEQAEFITRQVTIGMLLSSAKGAWDVSDGMSRLFPDYKFADIEAFLTNVWGSKPVGQIP